MHYLNTQIEFCIENPSSPFRGLSQKEKEAIVQHHGIVRVRRGATLFSEGEKMKGLVFIVSGKLKVFRTGVGGRDHIMKLHKAGDLAGVEILFTDPVWRASSVAIEDSVIINIERNTLIKVIRGNAELSVKLSRVLADELLLSYDKMVSLTQKHVRGRLVESLLMLGRIFGYESDGKTVAASISRNDLAHLSNMTTSNAIRTLSNLAAEGHIRIKGRKITLLNAAVLERISDQA